jgi:hypothetical protein
MHDIWVLASSMYDTYPICQFQYLEQCDLRFSPIYWLTPRYIRLLILFHRALPRTFISTYHPISCPTALTVAVLK